MTYLKLAPARASTTSLQSRTDAMWMFLKRLQARPRQSIKAIRSVESFSCRVKSREISLRLGQLITWKKWKTPINAHTKSNQDIDWKRKWRMKDAHCLRNAIKIRKPESRQAWRIEVQRTKVVATFNFKDCKAPFLRNKTTQFIPTI